MFESKFEDYFYGLEKFEMKKINIPAMVKLIKARRGSRRLEYSLITRTMIGEFHENIKGRIHKRDFEGKKIMTVENISPLKD